MVDHLIDKTITDIMITDYVNNMAMKFICFNFIIAFIILYSGGLPHSEGESRN